MGDETSIELTVSNKYSDSLFTSYLTKKIGQAFFFGPAAAARFSKAP